MKSYPVKENPIGSAVSEIFWYRQTNKYTDFLLLYFKKRPNFYLFQFQLFLYKRNREMIWKRLNTYHSQNKSFNQMLCKIYLQIQIGFVSRKSRVCKALTIVVYLSVCLSFCFSVLFVCFVLKGNYSKIKKTWSNCCKIHISF